MISKTCMTCGTSFDVFQCRASAKYCNIKCYPKAGAANPKWRGGVYVVAGYLYEHAPTHPNATKLGYVCQHRLVMEKVIGRFLNKEETVHHVNGDKRDNRPENLILCASNGRHTIDEHRPPRNKTGKFIRWAR